MEEITYTWAFNPLEVVLHENKMDKVVKVVHWRLTGVDADGYTSDIYGAANLSSPDPKDFIMFDNITEEDILAWITPVLGTSIEDMKKNIANAISIIKNPPIVSLPPPWIKPEEISVD